MATINDLTASTNALTAAVAALEGRVGTTITEAQLDPIKAEIDSDTARVNAILA